MKALSDQIKIVSVFMVVIISFSFFPFVSTAVGATSYPGAADNTSLEAAANQAPVAGDDAYTATQNTALAIPAPGVLTNDVDPDGSRLRAVRPGKPGHGRLTFKSDGSFTYVPDAGFSGGDSFTYQANDGRLYSNAATVTLTVTAGNGAPHAVDDSEKVSEDSGVNFFEVLNNDTDPELDSVSVTAVSVPLHGTTGYDSSVVTYTPAADYYGSDSFTYTISDGKGGSDTATVSVDVSNVNDAPLATDVTEVTTQNTAKTITLTATDIDGDALISASLPVQSTAY